MAGGWIGGNFSISIDMSARASAGENIEASAFSALHDVVKNGIDSTVNKAGANVPTADLPMGGNKHTGVGAVASLDGYMDANSAIHQYPVYMTDAEAAGSLTISCSAAFFPASLSAGARIAVKIDGAKPSAADAGMLLFVNGSSHSIEMPDGDTTMRTGVLISGQTHEFSYDGTHWQLLNPATASVDTFSQAQIVGQHPIYMLDETATSTTIISVSPSDWPTAVSAGTRINVKLASHKPHVGSSTSVTTSPMTLVVNGSSSPIVFRGSKTEIWPNVMRSAEIHEFIYDGTNWQLNNPRPSFARLKIVPFVLSAGTTTDTVVAPATLESTLHRDDMMATINLYTGYTSTQTSLSCSAIYLTGQLPDYMVPAGGGVNVNAGNLAVEVSGNRTSNYRVAAVDSGLYVAPASLGTAWSANAIVNFRLFTGTWMCSTSIEGWAST